MATIEEKNASILEHANPLWEIEECLKAVKALLPDLCDGVVRTQAILDLDAKKCKAVDKRLARVMRSFEMLEDCVEDFHDKATRVIQAEDDPLIVPLSGGGGKPPPCDDNIEDCP